MSRAEQLREMSADELEQLCTDTYAELFTLKNAVQAAKKDSKPHLIRQAKKRLARALTIIHEKQKGIR